jgi:hypothetical protein
MMDESVLINRRMLDESVLINRRMLDESVLINRRMLDESVLINRRMLYVVAVVSEEATSLAGIQSILCDVGALPTVKYYVLTGHTYPLGDPGNDGKLAVKDAIRNIALMK